MRDEKMEFYPAELRKKGMKSKKSRTYPDEPQK